MSAGGDAGARGSRWGAEDERGALNAIGAAEVLAALGLARQGRIIELGQLIGPATPVPGHRPPVARFMNRDGGDYAAGARRPGGFQFADDTVLLPTHVGTHIDSLAHAWHDDLLYNGFPAAEIRSTTGARRCGADKLGAVVARGVLANLAPEEGSLAAGERVSHARLEAALDESGVGLRSGDVVLVRTGWLEAQGEDPTTYFNAEPGLDVEAAMWLADAGVAAAGADNAAVEQIPFPDGEVFPVHQLLIRDRGVPLIEGLQLGELARSGAREFLFLALPLRLEGATASPLAPVAVI
jgi:kynurenine formamidase